MQAIAQSLQEESMGIEVLCDECGSPDALAGEPCCIDISNVSIRYGGKMIIEDVSMPVPMNAVTAIMGPSGCGKSTFLCCINKLTDLNTACEVTGDVRFAWENSAMQKNPLLLRRHVGMLFQRPNPFPFSIWRNLEFPLTQHGVTGRDEIAARIQTALEDVGLWNEVKHKLKTSALSLSGGQQQRLCLARALVLQPKVILMDEPCSALDPISSQKIEELIVHIAKTRTVILVTHNIGQARRVADYVALFWSDGTSGRLVEHGRAQEVFENPKNDFTRVYLTFG